eukprot:5322080-Pyramimonas_sp.AAC.1
MAYLGRATTHRGARPGLYLYGRVRDAVQRRGHCDQQRGSRGPLANWQSREENALPEGDGNECLQRWGSS